MVPTGPWKQEKSLNLNIKIPGLEKALIFVKTFINQEKSMILINPWCFVVDLEKVHAAATASN